MSLRPFREEKTAICAFRWLKHGWRLAVKTLYFIDYQLFRCTNNKQSVSVSVVSVVLKVNHQLFCYTIYIIYIIDYYVVIRERGALVMYIVPLFFNWNWNNWNTSVLFSVLPLPSNQVPKGVRCSWSGHSVRRWSQVLLEVWVQSRAAHQYLKGQIVNYSLTEAKTFSVAPAWSFTKWPALLPLSLRKASSDAKRSISCSNSS